MYRPACEQSIYLSVQVYVDVVEIDRALGCNGDNAVRERLSAQEFRRDDDFLRVN